MPKKLNPRSVELWLQRQKLLLYVRNTVVLMPEPYGAINEDDFLLEIEEICTCTERKAWEYFRFFLRQGYFIREKDSFKVVYEKVKDNKYDVSFPEPKGEKP